MVSFPFWVSSGVGKLERNGAVHGCIRGVGREDFLGVIKSPQGLKSGRMPYGAVRIFLWRVDVPQGSGNG